MSQEAKGTWTFTRCFWVRSERTWHLRPLLNALGKFKGDIHCAKKLGKGESDVRSITETFRRNSTGNQSRLVEPGKQPEARLAWGGVSRTAKRRQPVPMPCARAPKLPLVESPRGCMCVGPRRPIETGLVASVAPGSKSRAQAQQGFQGTPPPGEDGRA